MSNSLKKDLTDLADQINNWDLKAERFFLDYNTAIGLGIFTESMISSRILDCEDINDIKQYFIQVINTNYKVELLQKVVDNDFPQYSEMLYKLIVLK